ncbi:unnamed protein product [Calypogeia fissa]
MSLSFFPVLCHQSRLLPSSLASIRTSSFLGGNPLQNRKLKSLLWSRTEVKAVAGRSGAHFCSLSAEKTPESSFKSVPGAAVMGQEKVEAAFGSWKSPITADLVSGASLRLGGKALDSHGRLLWVEGRPTESGRYVLVSGGSEVGAAPVDITPPGFSIRTTVHEYGGGAFTVVDDEVFFSNYKDQRLYKQRLSGDQTPIPLTPKYDGKVVRYADGVLDKQHDRFITVREDHRQTGREAVNEIVAIQINGDPNSEPVVLLKGNDFYAYPRLSPDGKKMAWLEWSHPNMPWDHTTLWIGEMSPAGDVVNRICVAGGTEDIIEAPSEPRWSPQGELFFVSDRKSGFWNLYRWISEKKEVEPLYPLDAEFTRPLWNFGNTSLAFVQSGEVALENSVVLTYRQRGISYLGLLNLSTRSFSKIETPFFDITGLTTEGEHVYISGGSAFHPISVVKINLLKNDKGEHEYSVLWSSLSVDTGKYKDYISVPEVIEFQTKVEGQTAFANFYPPTNGDFKAPAGEKPPLLVRSHGGPTSEAKTTLDFAIQYWTSRGWAFADVNYGGSTGYGRAFRERLYNSWGIVDVNDCSSCAEFLAKEGKVDSKRLCIDGRSAGGYTTMAALVFCDTFTAGASLYGLSDLTVFVTETHKFESRYLDSLIGKDSEALYNRSPINFLDKMSCPIILFQGLEDKVVPPNQARLVYDAVKAKGLPVALIEYEGEQHGFLKAENIKNTLEQEMTFFARLIGGFRVADDITPIHIDNYDDK